MEVFRVNPTMGRHGTMDPALPATRQTRSPLVFISAAEPSADQHGAALIRACREQCPTIRFVGVAGPRMVDAGCDSIFDMTPHAAMLLGIVKSLARGAAMFRTSSRHLRRYPFDACVVIDSPMIHLPLAGEAHAAGIPVLYYIAPQLWAWGGRRIHKLRNRTERVAVILPFEEEFFRDRGVRATFVGHPLAERWASTKPDRAVVKNIRDRGSPVIALLPGSRKHVVSSVLPGQIEVARRIKQVFPDASFGVSVAGPAVAPIVESAIESSAVASRSMPSDASASESMASESLSLTTYPDHHTELITAADLVLVASGTTTLEVAFHKRPMIVMYQASRMFYHLVGRWLLRTPHLSLPNILAGRAVVPEFMPYYTSTAPIADQAIELLKSESQRQSMVSDLAELIEPLHGSHASACTARMLLEMMEEWSPAQRH